MHAGHKVIWILTAAADPVADHMAASILVRLPPKRVHWRIGWPAILVQRPPRRKDGLVRRTAAIAQPPHLDVDLDDLRPCSFNTAATCVISRSTPSPYPGIRRRPIRAPRTAEGQPSGRTSRPRGSNADRVNAASWTCRAIGPAQSRSRETGTTPDMLTRSGLGLRPTTPFIPAGQTSEPSVSVPGNLREPRGDPGRRAGGRAAGASVRRMRIPRLAADRGPPGDGSGGPVVPPLREVGLAEDHGPGGPQPPHQFRVPGRASAGKSAGARGGRHVGRVDVVLEQHRDTVQRPPQISRLQAAVGRRRLRDRGRLQRQNGPHDPVHATNRILSRYASANPTASSRPRDLHRCSSAIVT